jgi:hypothetical protein
METLFNVQPILPSKNKIVPDLSEHDCTSKFNHEYYYDLLFFCGNFDIKLEFYCYHVSPQFIVRGTWAKTFDIL